MDKELQDLFNAFERDGDVGACVKIVSKNFAEFASNEIIHTFPDQILIDILCSDEINFPEPDKTVEFFEKVFSRGPEVVPLYFPMIPVDELSKELCERLANFLDGMKCAVEARQMRRVVNLYKSIEDTYEQLKVNGQGTQSISEKLSHSTDLLNRMTTLLQQTSKSLDETTAELKKKTDEIVEKDKEITQLKLRLRSRR